MIKKFFKDIGVWNTFQKGFTGPIGGKKLSNDTVKQLQRNKYLNCKTCYYLSTQVQLHVVKNFILVKNFIYIKAAKDAWKILINFYSYDGEEIYDEKQGIENFDEAKKEEIAEIVDTIEDEEFVIQEEISHMVEKKKMKSLMKLKMCLKIMTA